jgi:hypothetical protein
MQEIGTVKMESGYIVQGLSVLVGVICLGKEAPQRKRNVECAS